MKLMRQPPSGVAAPEVRDEAMRAFVSAVSSRKATAPTWCPGWSTHEVVAHVAAAAQERANLIEEHRLGQSCRPTRSWEVREPPFRALPYAVLRQRLVSEAVRFERAVSAMSSTESIEYTGWTMTAERLRTHSRSEAVLHRWDLVGDDETSRRLLSEPALTDHAVEVFNALPALLEARRWVDAPFTDRPVRLRSAGQPDVLVTPGTGLSLVSEATDTTSPLATMDSRDRLLVLWGRCPAALRTPAESAETVDELLTRLFA
jgi:mycothiol maleylpyruvate isomerase-like protein